MDWLMKIIIIIFLLKVKNITSTSENDMKMIVDVIDSFEKPTDIVAEICWNESAKLKLIHKLNALQSAKRISYMRNNEICDERNSNEKLLIIVDAGCLNFHEILLIANSCKKFKTPNRWFIFGNSNETDKIMMDELDKSDVKIDSDILFSRKDGNNFELYMPYKIGLINKGWNIEYFGSWDQYRGFVMPKNMQTAMAIRRKNLRGEPITISTIITDNRTKSELYDMRNIHRDTLTKSSYRQYMPIFDFLNATKVIMYSGTWGYLVNGTFNGMVGDMARGEAELGGTLVFITRERLSVLNYMNYPGSLSVKFVFREPSLSYQHNLFLLPFKPIVWCCIVALVFILIFILFINARWESVKSQNGDVLDNTILKPNISDIAILVMSAISQQGSSTELKGALGRSVMFILFLAFVFLYTSYSASIVALLQSRSSGIRTLSDLLDSRLELGAEDTPYNRHYFPAATEPVKKAIYQNKIAPRGSKPNFMKLEDGVRKLQKEPFAFNMNTGRGYRLVDEYFYEHEKCGLQEISYFPNTKPWQTCRKDSPYKEILKIGSLRSHEHGLNMRVNNQMFSMKPACIVKGGNFGSVNIVDFYPAVLTLIYGMLLAIIIMIIEILLYQKLKTSTNIKLSKLVNQTFVR